MAQPPALKVGSFGQALVHFSLQRGSVGENSRLMYKAFGPFLDRVRSRTWLLGESDFLLQIQVEDFRWIRDVQSALLFSGVPASTWIYSIPYSEDPLVWATDNSSPRFLVYLRVNRRLYRAYGAEAENYVVGRLRELCQPFKEISGEVHFCLGSPDLIFQGTYSCTSQRLLAFVAALRSLAISKIEIFPATYSLLGFPWQGDLDAADLGPNKELLLSPIVFAKISPAALRSIERKYKKIRTTGLDEISFLDGKHDLMIAPKLGQLSLGDLRGFLRTLRKLGANRLETHSFGDVEELSSAVNAASRTQLTLPSAGVRRTCSCKKIALTANQHFRDQISGLPQGLRRDVDAVLSLLQAYLTDPRLCCDIERVFRASSNGLRILLDLRDKHREHLDAVSAAVLAEEADFEGHQPGERKEQFDLLEKTRKLQVFWFSNLRVNQEYIARWCRFVERAFRERAADSVTDLFGERKSLPEIRGGLQKLLFLADHLLNDFYEQIDEPVKETLAKHESVFFAAVYQPIGTIKSERYSGLIQVPSRYALLLHLVVPQLWHEVGQFIFQNRYGHEFSEKTIKVFGFLQDAGLRASDSSRFLADMADLYADMIVLHYGFRGDFGAFAGYLITLVLESLLYYRSPQSVQVEKLILLTRRLYSVNIFHEALLVRRANAGQRSKAEAEIFEDLKSRPVELMAEAARRIWSLIDESKRYSEIIKNLQNKNLRERVATRAQQSLGVLENGFYALFLGYMSDFLSEIDYKSGHTNDLHTDLMWEKVCEGHVVDLRFASISDLYLRLYKLSLRKLLNTPHSAHSSPEFRTMAALGRSAGLSFYRAGPKK